MHTYSPYRLAAPEPRALGFGVAGATLRAVTVAAALACGAGASMAGDAALKITSFTASTDAFSGNFAWADDLFSSQLYNLTAKEAGGLLGEQTNNFSADNWNLGPNRLAQTANTKATGNTVNFTDPSTQLTTAGFNLSAHATPVYSPPTQPNYANASAVQSGAFMLLDANGAPIGGTITFDLFYDMSVSTPGSSGMNYSQTQLNLLSSSDAGDSTSFADGLLSNNFTSGTGATSGHFSWTYTLAAGQEAFYTLSGSAIASAEIAAVPEPETYALMLLGLGGIGAVARRRRARAEPAAPAA
jgi:hypothetical protein